MPAYGRQCLQTLHMNRLVTCSLFIALFAVFAYLLGCGADSAGKAISGFDEWTTFAGNNAGIRYSSLDQITRKNVKNLVVAWTYTTADKGQIQCTPIIVEGVLYATSPRLKLFALEAATGVEKWLFDPLDSLVQARHPGVFSNVNRGVMYWENDDRTDQRIFYTVGARIFAVNAADGTLVESFGDHGSVDMRRNLDHEDAEDGYIKATSPGVIYNDLLIIGSSVAEQADALPGHIRAFDVRTGDRRWIFHTVPHPDEFGYDTWGDRNAWKSLGGANNWGGLSLDVERGIVYVSTGSASSDFYGGIRKGANLFANCIIALDAGTGKYIWHYQVIHHDLWDWDLPTNPNLVTVRHNGKEIDAVAQVSKHGFVFLLDRETGKPLFSIEEKPVPPSDLPGEEAWPTQPFPTLPEPFARQEVTLDDISDMSPEIHERMVERFRKVKHKKMFSPPSREGSFVFPGFDGGAEWGGAAVDPESGILYVNANEVPSIATMIDAPRHVRNASFMGIGLFIYDKYCLHCHGKNMEGNGSNFPSLLNVKAKYTGERLRAFIESGKDMMPPFKHMPDNEMKALLTFLMNIEGPRSIARLRRNNETHSASVAEGDVDIERPSIPYSLTGYEKFLDPDGYPGIKPPWGSLNAVDLNSGKLLWKVPLGEVKELTERGIPVTGTENYGGPVVTKGGLVFIAAAKDAKLRAFEKLTGEVLWEHDLPYAGYATPATYMSNGKQYVVIACGGGKLGSPIGDQYVAFALPSE